MSDLTFFLHFNFQQVIMFPRFPPSSSSIPLFLQASRVGPSLLIQDVNVHTRVDFTIIVPIGLVNIEL